VIARSLTLRAIVLAVLAGGLVRLIASDAYLAYVKPGMRLPLALSVVVLGVLALASATAADRIREEDDGPEDHPHPHDDVMDDHGHDHRRLPRIGWWLLAPVVCIALVPLNPLGADAVSDRAANEVVDRVAASGARSPEGEGADGVAAGETTLLDFVSRSINDPGNPFPGEVTLVGFVTSDPDVEGGFVLGRFVMSCCAADAMPLLVHVPAATVPPRDSWVRVTGRHVAPPEGTPDEELPLTRNIVLDPIEVEPIDQPAEPYESY
jgi:uncharacterized repeat protein (TIGR03943 family)